MWHVLSFRGNSIIGSLFLGKGGGVNPVCILSRVNFMPSIFRWQIKSKPGQFSVGYMRETTPEIKISIDDSAKFRNVLLVEMF